MIVGVDSVKCMLCTPCKNNIMNKITIDFFTLFDHYVIGHFSHIWIDFGNFLARIFLQGYALALCRKTVL